MVTVVLEPSDDADSFLVFPTWSQTQQLVTTITEPTDGLHYVWLSESVGINRCGAVHIVLQTVWLPDSVDRGQRAVVVLPP